ncbi:hypothetical protein RJ640_014639 [Escallonia rubra]|uniref:Agenet domain-containing protein n=1 Tax=Escallonia rubra TaxID=112253 RepID=A0AA88RJ71_9ASTE|nr:hypothetical protein RJ640_014639 [Escallonia rubra]
MPCKPTHLHKGATVEATLPQNDAASSSFYPATVLHSPSNDTVQLKFETLNSTKNPKKRLKDHVHVASVRPDPPPPELHRFFVVGEAVDGFLSNGWRKGKVVDILENSKYLVSFDGENENEEVEQYSLRLHRDWVDGSWVPPLQSQESSSQVEKGSRELKLRIKFSGRTSEEKFKKGSVVEVKSDEEGYHSAWYTAVVVGSTGPDKFLVEYQTLKTDDDEPELLQVETNVSCIRPFPPETLKNEPFEQFEQVDAWHNDGWWVGHVSKVLEGGLKYIVYFRTTNEEMVFEHSKLRPCQEWVDGKWAAASKRSSPDLKSKEPKVQVKNCTLIPPKFSNGMMVEVRSDEEGYQGSWYTATLVGWAGNDKFLVEYQTLRTEDESEPLREHANASYIRPVPPEIQRVDRFKMLEEVDAWYNDGWWVGLICKVLDGLNYAVYFWTTNEEMEFGHFKLRPHQEWTAGKWVASFMKKPKLPLKSRVGKLKKQCVGKTSVPNFSNGAKVEVHSDDEGYRGAWYPASIARSTGNGKYLVKYQTLKTDDETEFLKEEADALSIRPCPPVVQRVNRFKPLEEVDAWFNGGWWEGQVCKTLGVSKYAVYFRTTNEVLEFEHFSLRTHQDWIDGKWIGNIRLLPSSVGQWPLLDENVFKDHCYIFTAAFNLTVGSWELL